MTTLKSIILVALAVVGTSFVVGCGAAPEEHQSTTDEALPKCDPELGPCYNGGGGIKCDVRTMCCYQGGKSMSINACGNKLMAVGCRAPDGSTTAPAVQQASGTGHYWFEVYCPSWASYLASDPDCMSVGINWGYYGNNCTINAPGSGQVEVIFDPNCGGNCSRIQ